MSSAAACASARRKRAGNVGTDNKSGQKQQPEPSNNETTPQSKITPIKLLVEHNERIETIEKQIESLLSTNFEKNTTNSTTISSNDTVSLYKYIDSKIESVGSNKNIDSVLNLKLDSLKDDVLKNFNVYLEAANNIIKLQNRIGEIEAKIENIENQSGEDDNEHNILKTLIASSFNQNNNEETDDSLLINENDDERIKLTENDFIDINNNISMKINELNNESSENLNETKNLEKSDEITEIEDK